MKFWTDSFKDGETIPEEFAFGKYDRDFHVTLSDNRNPHLGWSNLPENTRSLVLICHDPDVPSQPDDVNQEGKTVPADLPRVDFYHWIIVDLKPSIQSLAVGQFSNGVTPKGKEGPEGLLETRQGINNYREWFAGDPDMSGDYFGYDGPCPPWNDELVHRYYFTLYAMDLERCPVDGKFTGAEVLQAIKGHILEQASIMGTYNIYPNATKAWN